MITKGSNMTVDATLSDERTTVAAGREPRVQVDPDALDEARKAVGFTYKELAEAVGVHKSMIGFLCKGRTITCTEALGQRIEDALGAEPGSLFKTPDLAVLLEGRGARANKPVAKPVEEAKEDPEK